MKQSTKRLLSLVVALVMIFAAIVIYFNMTVPEYNNADLARADVYARTQFVTDQQSAVDQVKKLVADYGTKGGLQQAVSLSLPLGIDQSGVLHQLQSMAVLNKLSVQSFSISAPSSQNASAAAASSTAIIRPISALNIQFRVIGTYEDFKTFLGNLETNLRIFDVKSISIDPLAKPNQDYYGFDVSVATYFQSP